MNIQQRLNWQSFKEAMIDNSGLDLQFRYADNKFVEPSYHITEIKQASITSVDCGGVMNSWTEIIVQLWVPERKQQDRAMKASRALSIIDIVERKLALVPDAIVKIEFGNQEFETRQMHISDFIIDGTNFIIDLIPDVTQCKAIERADNKGSACCTPASGCC